MLLTVWHIITTLVILIAPTINFHHFVLNVQCDQKYYIKSSQVLILSIQVVGY